MEHSTFKDGYDIVVEDQWRRKYHFKIASFFVPTGLVSEALEVKDEGPGYEFRILSHADSDPEAAEEELIKKVKRGLNRRHLKKRGGKWEIGARNILRGRIEYNDDFSDTEYDRIFIIDGQRITIEQFGGMLEPYEGFNFNFKIIDSSDDK
mgnify:CR=1 FL=1